MPVNEMIGLQNDFHTPELCVFVAALKIGVTT